MYRQQILEKIVLQSQWEITKLGVGVVQNLLGHYLFLKLVLLRAGDLYVGCLLWLFFPIGNLNMLFARDFGSANTSKQTLTLRIHF